MKNEPNTTPIPQISSPLSLKAQLGGWMLAILELFCNWEYICIEKAGSRPIFELGSCHSATGFPGYHD